MNERLTEVIPWLTLQKVPGVGNLLFRRLIVQFGSPDKVLGSTVGELVRVKGITADLARRILQSPQSDRAADELGSIFQAGYSLLIQTDTQYPPLLLQIPDPPPIIYYSGQPPAHNNTLAVVGARKSTAYGRKVTWELSRALAQHNITVVSGMALGIDTAAHQGALDGGGTTVAVLGSGLDHIYPTQNLKLSRQIAMSGCVMTEFSLGHKPEPHHFPLRNRIISGMSLGTVVVEAAPRSGSLITARLAAEQNREVFAVPGSIHAQTTRGTHDLIKQGAKLVETVDDILVEIWPHLIEDNQRIAAENSTDALSLLTVEEKRVYRLLDSYPVHIDELARRQSMPIGLLTSTLSQLVLKGMVNQEPGNTFTRQDRRQRQSSGRSDIGNISKEVL